MALQERDSKAEMRVHRIKWAALRFIGGGQSKENRTWQWENLRCPAITTETFANSSSDCTES